MFWNIIINYQKHFKIDIVLFRVHAIKSRLSRNYQKHKYKSNSVYYYFVKHLEIVAVSLNLTLKWSELKRRSKKWRKKTWRDEIEARESAVATRPTWRRQIPGTGKAFGWDAEFSCWTIDIKHIHQSRVHQRSMRWFQISAANNTRVKSVSKTVEVNLAE